MVKIKSLNQSGQAITEAVLLMVVFFGITIMVSSYFKSEELFASLLKRPWAVMSGVLQNGVMDTPERGIGNHPNKHFRHVSLQGDSPR